MKKENLLSKENILSTKEIEIYSFIYHFVKKHHISPSIREICNGVGLYSTSSAYTHLKRMQEAGIIRYQPNSSRSIILNDCDYSLTRKSNGSYPFDIVTKPEW